MAKICVLGLGYIGLPTASILASNGYKVIGVDISEKVIESLSKGNVHIQEPGLKTLVQSAIFSGNLKVSMSPEQADVFIITVPTPVRNSKADLTMVKSASKNIIPYLRKGSLVILESTVPPGTTNGLVAKILSESGLKAGKEIGLAYCPERVLPGNILKELVGNSRIIGGITKESSSAAKKIYETFVEGEILITDSNTAEMVKLIENTFRDVNIALANELALIAENINVNIWDAINLANRHPRVNLHKPGPGVGGHCIAVDPWFLVETSPKFAKLIKLARNINDDMPKYVADIVSKQLIGIKKPVISIFGVSYKGNVEDVRESPAISVINALKKKGCILKCYDPLAKNFEYKLMSLNDAVKESDCILILADHKEFLKINPVSIAKFMRKKILVDTRNYVRHALWRNAGFKIKILGGIS
ncbi:MAG: nucleotide sugar dehydrogenase [Candidatus Firestonebacteria bacterium]